MHFQSKMLFMGNRKYLCRHALIFYKQMVIKKGCRSASFPSIYALSPISKVERNILQTNEKSLNIDKI